MEDKSKIEERFVELMKINVDLNAKAAVADAWDRWHYGPRDEGHGHSRDRKQPWCILGSPDTETI